MLKDQKLKMQLEKEGYVVLDLFSKEKMDEVIQAADALHNFDIGERIFFSNQQYDKPEYQRQARALMKKHFEEPLSELFENTIWIESTFVIKPPLAGEFDNHQDWSLVDETKYRSYGIWCPLLDVDIQNGTFCLLPGSHHFYQTYRSCTAPGIYAKQEIKEVIDTHKVALKLKKGQVVIFDHAMVHSTTPNLSQQRRTAVFMGVRPAAAAVLHYYYDKAQQSIECFEVDADFFYQYDYVSRPANYKSLGVLDYKFPDLDAKSLKNKIKNYKKSSQVPFWKKWFNN